jgi:hypothetical protein
MTNQEIYNKGLNDAESVVIDKLKAYLFNQETTPFNNPELETIRQQLLFKEHVVKEIDYFAPNINDKFLTKLESSIKYSPERRNWTINDFGDERLDNLFKSWCNVVDHVWGVSKLKHIAAKTAKAILKESQQIIDNKKIDYKS